MKYRCLILDHDDTAVNSTASIHFPCFVEYIKLTHPEITHEYTATEYFEKNFDPGISSLLRDECGLTPTEVVEEEHYWSEYVKGHIPTAYPKIRELLKDFRAAGGILTVDSHSYKRYIERDYRHNRLPMPDAIYGWDIAPEKRKPAPDTVFEILDRFGLEKDEVLVVDDLKPGLDMALAAGVPFAASGWGYEVPSIEKFMREHCEHYCKTVDDLRELLFSE